MKTINDVLSNILENQTLEYLIKGALKEVVDDICTIHKTVDHADFEREVYKYLGWIKNETSNNSNSSS
jgi:hypothetical protein